MEELKALAIPGTKMICINNPNNPTGAFVTPGDCFEQARSFRIGYACDTEELKAGLAAISEYISFVCAGEI